MPYLPYAKNNTQSLIKEKLIKAINEVENSKCKFYAFTPETASGKAIEGEEPSFRSLLNKFYDNEQNVINNGGN